MGRLRELLSGETPLLRVILGYWRWIPKKIRTILLALLPLFILGPIIGPILSQTVYAPIVQGLLDFIKNPPDISYIAALKVGAVTGIYLLLLLNAYRLGNIARSLNRRGGN
jgi:hypothetical protein